MHRNRPHNAFSSSYEEELNVIEPNVESQIRVNPLPKEEVTPRSATIELACLHLELPPRLSHWDQTIPPLNLIYNGNPMWVFFLVKFEENPSFLLRSIADIFPEFTTCEMKENLEYGDFCVNLILILISAVKSMEWLNCYHYHTPEIKSFIFEWVFYEVLRGCNCHQLLVRE